MKVLLVSANTEQINMPVLPVGLACVAAATAAAGHEVRFLNLMTRNDSGLLTAAIEEFRPDAIGISVRNVDDQSMHASKFLLENVREMVNACRSLSSAPIILGGAGYSIFPHSALSFLGADMGIRGEGETSFVVLLDRLSRNMELSDIPGIVLPGRDSGPVPEPAELDALPLPVPNGLLSFPRTFENQEVWLPFQTRRGCPMACSYCSTAAIEGRRLRKRSPARVIDSLAQFSDAGFKHYFFVDNTFNFPPSYAGEISDGIIARELDIRWRCILYPWKVDEALVARMARAGCVEAAFGFESGSEKMLRSMNKRYMLGEARAVSEILEKHGIGRMGFLLLGGPGETRETVEKSFDFAESLELESVKVTTGIRIYPHTALADIARREGRIGADSDLLYPTFYLEDGLKDWLPEAVAARMRKNPNWIS